MLRVKLYNEVSKLFGATFNNRNSITKVTVSKTINDRGNPGRPKSACKK